MPTLEEIATDLDRIERLERELAEARAEIERKNETIDACSFMLRARETLISKQMKLIEQMREALENELSELEGWHGDMAENARVRIEAALRRMQNQNAARCG